MWVGSYGAFICSHAVTVPEIRFHIKITKNDSQKRIIYHNWFKIYFKVLDKWRKIIFTLIRRAVQRNKITELIFNFYFKINTLLQVMNIFNF